MHSGLGIVRLRPLADEGDALEIVGAPASVAARLAERAEPDQILVTADTQALLRAEIECEPCGDVPMPDGSASLPVFRVVRERPPAALEMSSKAGETPFVGRAGEYGQLVEL